MHLHLAPVVRHQHTWPEGIWGLRFNCALHPGQSCICPEGSACPNACRALYELGVTIPGAGPGTTREGRSGDLPAISLLSASSLRAS